MKKLHLPAFVFASSLVLAVATLPACELTNTPTKVAKGQLYSSGDGRYDPYFNAVHQEQLAAANWPDESKNARKPIITALSLRPGTSNTTILSAAKEKRGDEKVGQAINETVPAERELAHKLHLAADKLEEMKKKGEELRKQAIEDKKNLGTDKADEKISNKKDEIKREISAAVDAVDGMATDAKKGAEEADELARKLKSAWSGKEGDDVKEEKKEEKKEDKKEDPKKPAAAPPGAKKPASGPAKKPAAKPTDPPADKPAENPPAEKPAEKPAAKPTTKPPDEVFNP